MPGYIKRQLLKYKHVVAPRPQHCPYSPEPRKYGTEAQAPLPPDTMRKLDKDKIKKIQKIVGSILYYARAVDMMVLMALSTIASKQTTTTEINNGKGTAGPRLPCGAPQRNSKIQSVRYGHEYTFRCLLPHRAEST